MVVAVAATVMLAFGASPAQANVTTAPVIFMPWQMQAALQDPEKPMCVGVQTSPVWGDKGDYTGACRYGAPLGPMNAAVNLMDRKKAANTAREYGLADRFAVRLETELNTIAGLPFTTGVTRLKRHARSETRAAKDGDSGTNSSWIKRAAVNCAIFGAAAAELTFLYEVIVNHKLPKKEIAKNAAFGCATAVVTPPLNNWIKSKGYDL
jgi:hypothetical protein